MLLGSLFVRRSTWKLCVAAFEVLAFPNELLKEVSLILGQEKLLGLLDDLSEICDQALAFSGKLWGRRGQRL